MLHRAHASSLVVLSSLLLFGCGGGGGGGSTTTTPVSPNPTNTYTVSTSTNAGGSISPTSAQVNGGSTTSFVITPNTGYAIGSVSGCSGKLAGSTYTTGAINAACTVTVTFSIAAPMVMGTNPPKNANGASLTGAITATFNKPMLAASFTSGTFVVSSGGALINGTVSLSADGMTASFSPTNPLAYYTTYTVTLLSGTGGVKDTLNLSLGSDYIWSFNTGGKISAGTLETCVRLDSEAAKCWGFNSSGQLGLGDAQNRGDQTGEMGDNLPTIDLGTGRVVVEVVAGKSSHACARLDNGVVKCWGNNVTGKLGLGDASNRGIAAGEMGDNLPVVNLGLGRRAARVALGNAHTCALLDNGTIKCWGGNFNGQLGIGSTSNRGDNLNEMGDNLPAVDLGTGRKATHVAAGEIHTCARLDNGTLKCWGFNFNGELGLGDTNTRGDVPFEMGDNLPAVNLGTGRTVTDVAAGSNFTCAHLDNGSVKCWGDNTQGQLGLGDTALRGDMASEMGDNLPAVDLGTGRTAVEIVVGTSHVCARLDNGAVKCWGNNSSGQLGLGETGNRGDQAGEMGDNLPVVNLGTGRTAVELAAGSSHTCARLDDGSLKCWGGNITGALGLGDTLIRGLQASQMGDNLPVVDYYGTGSR